MWKRIVAYILFGLGLLTVIYFRAYKGDLIPYPSLFWLLGFALCLSGYIFLRNTPTAKEIVNQKSLEVLIKELKENGEQIKVDLTQCQIKEHSFFEEKEKFENQGNLLTLDMERNIEAWNALRGKAKQNIEQVHVKQSVIILNYKNMHTGQFEKFISRVIPKDEVTLSVYLFKQKQTILYVDKNNRASYYFDLKFLNT